MATSLGSVPLISGQDILVDSATQNFPLGAYAETNDGRGFRYCKVGATSLVPGKVYQGPAQDTTNYNPSGGLAVNAAVAIGGMSIATSTSTTWTVNALAGGYLCFVAGTPAGTLGGMFRIKSNTATSAAVGGIIVLEDPLIVAVTTSSKFIVQPSLYNGVVVAPATLTSAVAGVATNIVTNAQFGWLQTHGTTSCLQTGTGTVGTALGVLQGGTIGSLAPAIAGTPIVGWCQTVNITGEYDLVFLTID